MYYIHEGSADTDRPQFLTLPTLVSDASGARATAPLFLPDADVAKWFFKSGMAEKSLITWARDTFIQPDRVFLDIGAHVGTYAWTCGSSAQHTYAFECGPTTFCYLAANIALHGLCDRITPLPYALGERNDEEVEYIVRSTDGGGNGVKVLCDADRGDSTRKLRVPMRTLDSFGLSNIGFIKLDVEGYEKEVLMGAQETLARCEYPRILFESWGAWKTRDGVDAPRIRAELFAFLESLSYTIVPVRGYPDMFLAEHGRV
jgi:FkbM family methyltransferase